MAKTKTSVRQFGSHYKMKCSTCGRIVGAKIPRHGNGTAHITRRHFKPNSKERCPDWKTYDTEDGDYLIE